jgi:hypothetical protein
MGTRPRSPRLLLAAGGIIAAIALCGCASSLAGGAASPPVQGSAACRQLQAMNLPALDNAVDAANDYGAQPPNGATQLTGTELEVMRADGGILFSVSAPSPQFEQEAHLAGQLVQTIGNSVNGYVDNNQAPAMDRYERYLQGVCGQAS